MKFDDIPEDELEVNSFTITMKFAPRVTDQEGNPLPPKFSFQPTKGMNPLDCIALCNQGISWALTAAGLIQEEQIRRIGKAVAKKQDSRVIRVGRA